MADEVLWTGFDNRKLAAERAKKDEKGRSLSDALDTLDSIETGAEVNVIESVQLSGEQAAIAPVNKNVTIPMATAPGSGTSGSTGVVSAADKAIIDKAGTVIPQSASALNMLATMDDLAMIGSFQIVTLTSGSNAHPDVQNPSTKIIYLTKASGSSAKDPYTEWIWNEQLATPAWEIIGETSVNLSNYSTKTDTERYSTYTGGTGIAIAGFGMNTKTISTTLTEVPILAGTGIEIEDNTTDFTIKTSPEVFMYRRAAITNYTPLDDGTNPVAIIFDPSGSTTFDNKATPTISLDGTAENVIGLDSDKMYRCTASFSVKNTGANDHSFNIGVTSWSGTQNFAGYSIAGTEVAESVMWYVKGATTISIIGSGDNTSTSTEYCAVSITDISVEEVCDVT